MTISAEQLLRETIVCQKHIQVSRVRSIQFNSIQFDSIRFDSIPVLSQTIIPNPSQKLNHVSFWLQYLTHPHIQWSITAFCFTPVIVEAVDQHTKQFDL